MRLRLVRVALFLLSGLLVGVFTVWGEELPVESQVAVPAELVVEEQQASPQTAHAGTVEALARDAAALAEEEAAVRAADSQFAAPKPEVVPQAEVMESPTPIAEPASSNSSQPEPSLYRLAVVGVKNETREKEFSKLLIAQGVSQLVAQALFDTGRYVPVEDNPEITGKINELMALAASTSDEPFDYARMDRQTLGCDAMASATIKKFSKSRTRGFAGPFSAANVEIEIEVEVAVREGDKPVMVASGSGTGTTKSRGVLFQVREDKVHFDQTSVGQATETAVQQAVSRLLAQRGEGG